MKIVILSVGKLKNISIINMCNDFKQRISHSAKIDEVVIKDSENKTENKKILSYLNKDSACKIALSADGEAYSSKGFSQIISNVNYQKITFVIGGPEGLTQETKKECDKTISLSSMTFTHEMAKMILFEQIYRSITILQNKKYHK